MQRLISLGVLSLRPDQTVLERPQASLVQVGLLQEDLIHHVVYPRLTVQNIDRLPQIVRLFHLPLLPLLLSLPQQHELPLVILLLLPEAVDEPASIFS